MLDSSQSTGAGVASELSPSATSPTATRGRAGAARRRRGLPPGRDGRPRSGHARHRRLCAPQRPRYRGAAARAGGVEVHGPARAGEQHGRVRRGRLPLCARTATPARAPRTLERAASRALRAALPALRARRSSRSRSTSQRRSIRAACTPPRRSTRSTCASRSRARPAFRSPRCATTTSTGRGCRATPRTPGGGDLRRGARAPDEPPRVFEDGRQLRDFVHVRDVARANVIALTRDEPADRRLQHRQAAPRARSPRWPRR